ncbi:MAG: hypothetical protein AB1461_11610 [Thermodesulfobacteriota bacterium]
MKKQIASYALLSVVLCLPESAAAEDFFDIIRINVSTTGTSSSLDLPYNGAQVTASWTDADQDGDLDVDEVLADPVQFYDRSGALALSSATSSYPVLTRADLERWAEEHADEIYQILFPGGVSQGITDLSMITQTGGQRLFQKAQLKKTGDIITNNEFAGAVEYVNLEVNDDSGDAYSAVISYSHEADSGLEMGFVLPYRFTDMDDVIDTKSHFVALEPYLKKKVWEHDDLSLFLGGALTGAVFYMKSDSIEDSGNLLYGGGLFTSFQKPLGPGNLSGGVEYRITKTHLPSGLNDSDNVFVEEAIDYINDLDPVHTASYGFNYGIAVQDNLAFNLQVLRSHFISSDIDNDRDTQTMVGLSAAYLPTDTFEINLGVRSIYELEDVDSYGVMLNVINRF